MTKLSDFHSGFDGWQSVNSNAAQKPAIPDPTTTPNPYLRGPLPLVLTYSPDSLRQFNRGGIPNMRVSPTAPSASAANNAAVQNISETVSTIAVTSMVNIGLSMPPIFSVSGSPAGNNGTFVVSTNNEQAGYAWSVPTSPTGIVELDTVTPTSGTGGLAVTGSATPTNVPEWAFFIGTANGTELNELGAPWVNAVIEGGTPPPHNVMQAAYMPVTSTAPITASATFNGAPAVWASQLLFFGTSGTTPSIRQFENSLNGATNQVVMDSNTLAGSSMIVAFEGIITGSPRPSIYINDSQGNKYTYITSNYSETGGGGDCIIYTFMATNIVGGPLTVDFSYSNATVSGQQWAWEATNLGPVLGQPVFRQLFYQTIESNGSMFPERHTFNVLSPLTLADNIGNDSTDIGFAAVHFNQASASASWVITHNLNSFPSVAVADGSGHAVIPDITYNTLNQCTLAFNPATAGDAYLI